MLRGARGASWEAVLGVEVVLADFSLGASLSEFPAAADFLTTLVLELDEGASICGGTAGLARGVTAEG